MSYLSFVIPCYRSQETITSVVEEIAHTVERRGTVENYEIILVNDGSPDRTAEVITNLCKSNDRVVFVNLSRNFGQHSAILAGFRQVRGDIVICLDDDGQTPANECFKLIDKVQENFDIVFARYRTKQHSAFRNFGSNLNAKCNHYFFNQPKDLCTSSYFACKRFVVDNAVNYKNPYPYIGGLLFQSVRTYTSVDIVHRNREYGASGYTLKKLFSLLVNGITAFSIKPLRMADYLGIIIAVIGFIIAFATIINKIVHPEVAVGWSSIIATILFIGGTIISLIGILGEYIGRIYLSINNSPQYVVREVIDQRENKQETGKLQQTGEKAS